MICRTALDAPTLGAVQAFRFRVPFYVVTPFARVRQGLSLTRKAWGVIRSHPTLVKLPITGGILGLLIFAVFGLPAVFLLNADDTWPVVGGFALLLIGVYLAEFVIVFFQVALVAGADQVLRGEEPDIGSAKRLARQCLGPIAGWRVASFLVGLLLGAVSERGGVLGRMSAAVGAAIWSLVAFLVLPILAFEGIGPIAALKRSPALAGPALPRARLRPPPLPSGTARVCPRRDALPFYR